MIINYGHHPTREYTTSIANVSRTGSKEPGVYWYSEDGGPERSVSKEWVIENYGPQILDFIEAHGRVDGERRDVSLDEIVEFSPNDVQLGDVVIYRGGKRCVIPEATSVRIIEVRSHGPFTYRLAMHPDDRSRLPAFYADGTFEANADELIHEGHGWWREIGYQRPPNAPEPLPIGELTSKLETLPQEVVEAMRKVVLSRRFNRGQLVSFTRWDGVAIKAKVRWGDFERAGERGEVLENHYCLDRVDTGTWEGYYIKEDLISQVLCKRP